MSSPPSDDSHNELKTLRNKQIEIVDRLDQLEGKITQFSERLRKLEEIVARHDPTSASQPARHAECGARPHSAPLRIERDPAQQTPLACQLLSRTRIVRGVPNTYTPVVSIQLRT